MRLALRLVQQVLGGAGDDLRVGRNETAALDQLHEGGLEVLGQVPADLRVNLDVRPLPEQIEVIGIPDIATEYAVLYLRRRLVHGVLVGLVEGTEERGELCSCPTNSP